MSLAFDAIDLLWFPQNPKPERPDRYISSTATTLLEPSELLLFF
ncbi:MAG: hypothetical protein ACJZ9G_11835 [Rhodospirillales bacterium]